MPPSPPKRISSSGSVALQLKTPMEVLSMEADELDVGQTPSELAQQLQFDDSEGEFHPMDGGPLAWLVCLTAFCSNGTVFAIINSFGIICEWLIVQNGAAKSLAGAIGSAAIGCLFFFSFVASVVTDRVGIRPCAITGGALCTISLLSSSFAVGNASLLILTHSVLFGLGSALVYTPSLVILGHHFERHLGLVNGIVTLGSGVFSVVLARTLKPVLLDNIGLANTFRVLGGFTGLLMLYAVAWIPKRSVRHAELDHYLSARSSLVESVSGVGIFLTRFFNVSIWRSRGFVVWTVAGPVVMFGYFVPFIFLPNFIQSRVPAHENLTASHADNSTDRRITSAKSSAQEDAAVLLICISVGSGVAKVVFGRLADSKCVSRVRLQQAAYCTLGVSTMLFPPCNHQVLYILLSLLFGICDGAIVCLIGPIAFDLVGPSGASQAIGFLLLAMAVPITAGPLLAGYINDVTGRWDIPFYVAGVSAILGAAIIFLIPQPKQAFPAASMAEDFDQMAKSNLDVAVYKEGQARDENGWHRASGTLSAGRSSIQRQSARVHSGSPQLGSPALPDTAGAAAAGATASTESRD